MVSSGMKDCGYQYVNLDNYWEGTRDANGHIQPNGRFPDMKALTDYVHSKGLKCGIYTTHGDFTCGGYIGTPEGYVEKDIEQYGKWGIDYVKVDNCGGNQSGYEEFRDAIEKFGRPMVFSSCSWGFPGAGVWDIGHLRRTSGDIRSGWNGGFTSNIVEPPLYPAGRPALFINWGWAWLLKHCIS
jgi:alpha-galactosidase